MPVRTLLAGNQHHDTRIAQLDSAELKNASAQDIVNAVTGSDNWTSILACCKLRIGTNKLATETSERLMHPDKWTIPALEEHMGGSITLMAAGYTPAPVEADGEPRNKKNNRQPQHRHLAPSRRQKKLPPGREPDRRWGDDPGDDDGWRPDEPDQPPDPPVQPAPAAPIKYVRVMRLKNTFAHGQVAPMHMPLAFQAHAEDGALTIRDSESLLRACSWLAGGDTTHSAQLMEVTVYNSRGHMRTHHRGICYNTRISELNARETDRIVLWDSTTSNIMSHNPFAVRLPECPCEWTHRQEAQHRPRYTPWAPFLCQAATHSMLTCTASSMRAS